MTQTPSGIQKAIQTGFENAVYLCLDEMKTEPKRILHIGGCRQRWFLQHIALLFPAAEIHALDTDADIVQKTKEDICCRFQFMVSDTEKMPYPNDYFDLTLGHGLLPLVKDLEKTMDEISRITQGYFFYTSTHRLGWQLLNALPGVDMKSEGADPSPIKLNDLYRYLNRHGKTRYQVASFPWDLKMAVMKPIREERLILSNTEPEVQPV